MGLPLTAKGKASPRKQASRPAEPRDFGDGELDALLESIFRVYGYDFREYARASLKRRIRSCMNAEGLVAVPAYSELLEAEPSAMERFLLSMTVSVTAMFRDPGFYQVFRSKVLPMLRTFPFIRIWHAGCSTGQEAYSMAILLTEEGLYERCRIYATDLNLAVVKKAKEGIYPLSAMKKYTENYIAAGGARAFSEYYTANYNNAIFNASLRKNIVFAQHNLVSDGSFNEFHIILCRNVMIYFNENLQPKVHNLFYQSLATFGYLALGTKESIGFSGIEDRYQEIDARNKIYRKTV